MNSAQLTVDCRQSSAPGRCPPGPNRSEFKDDFERLKKLSGYRWIVINRDDLVAINTLSIGSKAGILDAEGKVLKAADMPRRRV